MLTPAASIDFETLTEAFTNCQFVEWTEHLKCDESCSQRGLDLDHAEYVAGVLVEMVRHAIEGRTP